jgi:hypothetical protein
VKVHKLVIQKVRPRFPDPCLRDRVEWAALKDICARSLREILGGGNINYSP